MNRKRIFTLKAGRREKGPVAYWMSRDQRVHDNWALIYAQELAMAQQEALVVLFCLVPSFLGAAVRQYLFMLAGLREVEKDLSGSNIPFYLVEGNPESTIPDFLRKYGIKTLVTVFDPLRIKRGWKRTVAEALDIPFFEVDTHNIIPCRVASEKLEYGAYTLRPKIRRLLDEFVDEFPEVNKHPFPWKGPKKRVDWKGSQEALKVGAPFSTVDWITPGEAAARETLEAFLASKIYGYGKLRNDPNKNFVSNLSPFLHFGHISSQRVLLEIRKAGMGDRGPAADFIEELAVRKELSDNYCFYNRFYDSMDGLPDWARKTLNEHRNDTREYTYTLDDFEQGKTHDDLWNAAQVEMVLKGKMHGYMRMYWAKKILEWTRSPEEAYETAIFLNDRYELDGRDPNGYAGVAWSIGGLHDRAWSERAVFGKVRYMSYGGCKAKFKVKEYIEHVRSIAGGKQEGRSVRTEQTEVS
jgi:deoxyribodipyrimidine photo-lyase